MSTTRPRHSVLNLFDPLASPNTPDRDAPSPDSDKENSTPPVADCSMAAAFFGRSYKQTQHATVVPKRRLVDIGDITVDDASMHAMLTDEEELEEFNDDENDTLTFFRPAATPSRPVDAVSEPGAPFASTPRTPLGELALDRDLTPVARTKMYRRTAPPSSSLVAPEILISPPRVDSSITSVIDAVNSSGMSFAQSGPTDTEKHLNLVTEDLNSGVSYVTSGDIQTPHITISSPDPLADSLSMMNLETSADSLLTDTTRPPDVTSPSPPPDTASPMPHHLRPNPPKTSSHDPHRRSIDLYSSFQLQLQSEDASFDLLNDKVSFLASGSGMDSFLSGMEGDDSFDMGVEEANMEAALNKMKLEDEVNKNDDKEPSPEVAELLTDGINTPPKPALVPPLNTTFETKPEEKRNLRKRLSFGYNPSLKSPKSPTVAPGPNKPFLNNAPSPITSPTQIPRVSVFTAPPLMALPNTISTPLAPARECAVLPAAVPALRIVKRVTRFGHEKSTSSGSASSTEAPSVPEAPFAADTAPRRPAPPTLNASTQPARSVSAASGSNRGTMAQATTILPLTNKSSTGPRRVPMINSQTIASSGRGVAKSSKDIATGPRRVPIVSQASVTEPAVGKLPAVTGLRAPTKYGAGISATSALPRPASRLPAPITSGTGKLRTVISASRIGSGVAVPDKSIPTRRMMYGGQ